MGLQFHQTTFNLLQCEPVVSQSAVKKIASLEAAIGIRLPESIQEWYCLNDAVKMLDTEDETVRFEPYSIDLNAQVLTRHTNGREQPCSWIIGGFSSGVSFAAPFPTEPDPIVGCYETDGSRLEFPDEWNDRPFSTFAFTCCWYRRLQTAKTISGTDPSFAPPLLDMLIELFEEGPRVMRPDVPREIPNPFTQTGLVPLYRFHFYFFGPSGMLSLRSRDDPTVSVTEVKWTLASFHEETLSTLASQLRDRGILTR